LLDFKIIFLDEVGSTHKYLKQYIKQHNYAQPIAIVTQNQTDGIGSRNNTWEGKKGNLFFSFVVSKDYLPLDLLIQSSSIYFSYLFKDILQQQGSNVWLKWPNDFYIDDKKIGGMISNIVENFLVCGIGLNLQSSPSLEYGQLDIKLDREVLLNKYFELIIDIIFQFKGTLDKFIGDAVMIFFGAPIELENYVECCLDCAIEIQKRILNIKKHVKFEIGIGINFGEVIVGNVGSKEKRIEYTVIGDTVNTAQRVEKITPGNKIFITENVLKNINRKKYKTTFIGEHKFKGKTKLVKIYDLTIN